MEQFLVTAILMALLSLFLGGIGYLKNGISKKTDADFIKNEEQRENKIKQIETNRKNLKIKPLTLKQKIIILSGIGLLLITNPTPSDFKTYLESKGVRFTGEDRRTCGREYNFLIFSIYITDSDDDPYIGILKNFIKN